MQTTPKLARTLISSLALCALTGPLLESGCDKRTAKERGRDYAKEKVEYAEGAVGVLEEKGKSVGKSAGKGIADLVKGAGSGVKDVVYAPVKVTLDPGLAGPGLKVLQANERGLGETAPKIAVNLDFPKAFEGRLQLRAFASEGEGKEIARSLLTPGLAQAAGSTAEVVFEFSGQTRLSGIDHCVLVGVPPKTAVLEQGLAGSGINLSQLREGKNQITLYVVFDKPFRGGLQLRAYADDGRELGRSEPTAKLTQSRDSASHMTFDFDPKTPLGDATRFTLHKAEPKQSPK
jgi:hypothetical protein